MASVRKSDILLFATFLGFSVWFFGKSFGFDSVSDTFWVARHQVGDFGLHLSLIRSISWGANWPMELPFYPGRPLAYHYGFDFPAGLLERTGVRLDVAINFLSVISLVALFYGIYMLGRSLFRFSRAAAWIATMLSIAGGGFAALMAFMRSVSVATFLRDAWFLPDYIYKGPFDGSNILTFFTPNVLLNQRHLIMALAMHIWIFYFLMKHQTEGKTAVWQTTLLGFILGISLYVHSLLFFASVFVISILCISQKRWKQLAYLLIPSFLIALPHMIEIYRALSTGVGHAWVRFGFLTPEPVTFTKVLTFWWENMGLTALTIPVGLLLANRKERSFSLPFILLFIIANVIQFSFRPDHNHSLFNLIFIVGNFYTVITLTRMWNHKVIGKVGSVLILILLTGSGFLNLMAVKNDFRYPIPELTSPFARWARIHTPPDSIFLSHPDIIDPVTLAGRYTYVGSSYYLSVLGYSYADRVNRAAEFFASSKSSDVARMRNEGIDYILIPKKPKSDYPYAVNEAFFRTALHRVYEDETVSVYSL